MPTLTVDTHTLEEKTQKKSALQKEQNWPAEPKRALLCIPTGMSDSLGGELLKELLPGLLQMPMQIIILGKGPASYGAYVSQLTAQHPQRLAIIPHDEHSVHMMLTAADMSLFLTDPTNLPEVQQCLQSGAVPIAPMTDTLTSYDPNQESGCAFLYEKLTVWHAFAAVVRALETYRFPYDWKTIQMHGMEENH